jgi:hypothetical protein
MPRIYVYEGTRLALSVWVPNLEEVWLDLERLGRQAEARKRRKTYEVKDEDWTMRDRTSGVEVSLAVSGDLW